MMDVKVKTKDNQKDRINIKEYWRRRELWLHELKKGKIVKSKTSFSFTFGEKREICEWVKKLRMLEGYALKLGKRADINEGKSIGVKSHDCHVFHGNFNSYNFYSSNRKNTETNHKEKWFC